MSEVQSVETPLDTPAEELPSIEEQNTAIEEPQPQEVTEEATPPPSEEEPGSLEIQEQAQNVLEAAGLNLDEFTQEFTDNGNLSEDSFSKLENAGFPRAMVDQYIK